MSLPHGSLGSAVVCSLFIVTLIICWVIVLGSCFFIFAVLCVLSSFAIILLEKTELCCVLNVMSLLSFCHLLSGLKCLIVQ